jgi:hypothetical protein
LVTALFCAVLLAVPVPVAAAPSCVAQSGEAEREVSP